MPREISARGRRLARSARKGATQNSTMGIAPVARSSAECVRARAPVADVREWPHIFPKNRTRPVDFAQPIRRLAEKWNMRSVESSFTIRDLTPNYVIVELNGHRDLGRLEMHLAIAEGELGSVSWWMNYAGDFVYKQIVGRA